MEGEGKEATVRCAAPVAPRFQYCFSHLLHKQRDAIGSFNDVLPTSVGTSLLRQYARSWPQLRAAAADQ